MIMAPLEFSLEVKSGNLQGKRLKTIQLPILLATQLRSVFLFSLFLRTTLFILPSDSTFQQRSWLVSGAKCISGLVQEGRKEGGGGGSDGEDEGHIGWGPGIGAWEANKVSTEPRWERLSELKRARSALFQR